jgi:hypothetical protein
VNAVIVNVAVVPPSNSIATTWWSTTSLSQRYTHRPYGPSRSAVVTDVSVTSSASTLTGQPFRPARTMPRYSLDAEYGHVGSTAQSRHLSAEPAGAFSAVKWRSEPKLDTRSIGLPTMCRSQSMSWPDFASSMNDASSVRRQFPRTYECAWCQCPTGSRCCTLTTSPIRPSSMSCFTSRVYGRYRITWHTANSTPASVTASTSSVHASGVGASGFSTSRW